MTDIYSGIMDGLKLAETGREDRRNRLAGDLYAQAMQAPVDQRAGLLAQMARVGGMQTANTAQTGLSKLDDSARDDLVQAAGQFVAIADDPATAQAMYPALAAKAHAIGIPVPATYDPRLLPNIQKLAGAMGGTGGSVQSTYIDDQGQRVAIMRDGSVRPLGQNAPNNQIIDTGNGFFGVNKGNLQAAPVMVGGQPRASGEVPFSIDPSLPPEVQASIRANEPGYAAAPDGGQVNLGAQLRSAPKPPAPPSQLQLNADARDAERLRLQQEAAARAAQGKPADQAKAEKLAAARADALDSVNQAIDGIDTLTKGGGFDNLGTFTGDVLGMIPHTQTRDARNALDTVRNQVLLTTLGKLKALSATGASGFGALSNQEGKILQNSIANLETAQSHDAIVHNLHVIRLTLQKAAGLIGQGGAQQPQSPAGWSIQAVP